MSLDTARRRQALMGAVLVIALALPLAAVFVGNDSTPEVDSSSGRRPTEQTGPVTTGRVTTVPATTVPITTGSITTGPATTGPITTGPITTGPATTGPITTGPGAAAELAYRFPIEPASVANYAHAHHDYPATDIFATCGSTIVAPVGGVIQETNTVDRWDSATNKGEDRGGLSFALVGDDGVRYYGSHLRSIGVGIGPGVRVDSGDPIGKVGDTGNAAGTGCHLHFGISRPCGPGDWERRRGEIWPWRYLDAWRGGESLSPVGDLPVGPCSR